MSALSSLIIVLDVWRDKKGRDWFEFVVWVSAIGCGEMRKKTLITLMQAFHACATRRSRFGVALMNSNSLVVRKVFWQRQSGCDSRSRA